MRMRPSGVHFLGRIDTMLQWNVRLPLLLMALVTLAMFVGKGGKGDWLHLGW